MRKINFSLHAGLLFVFFIVVAGEVNAQISVGPLVGINWARLVYKNPSSFESITSFGGVSAGVVVEVPFNGFLTVRFEPSYIQKGADETLTAILEGPLLGSSVQERLKYLQLPIELKANLPVPVLSPYIFIGPNVGYLLSANVSAKSETMDIKSSYKNFDFGVDLGAGIEYSVAPFVRADIEYKLSSGLLNIRATGGGSVRTYGNQIIGSLIFSI